MEPISRFFMSLSVAILVKFIGSFMLQLLNRSDREPSILYYRDLLLLACGDLTG